MCARGDISQQLQRRDSIVHTFDLCTVKSAYHLLPAHNR